MGGLDQAGLSRRSMGLLFIGVVALALIVLFFILPLRSNVISLQSEVDELRARIQEQQILQPIYVDLLARLDDSTGKQFALEGLDRDFLPLEIMDAPEKLEAMAENAGLRRYTFYPVPESLTDNSQVLLLEGGLIGAYPDFRSFLLELLAWDNFNRLELLEVRGRKEGTEFEILIWLNIG
ncbi:hypothetical protein [Desulfonatronospira sp.]|uniref:hypothetical protein n=1 Tax=Desulfonatronospira sp. TaxID=1962951 RepID=UPI0025C00E0B|nr:hypothetical protein [Desulfonatronospira sp.]